MSTQSHYRIKYSTLSFYDLQDIHFEEYIANVSKYPEVALEQIYRITEEIRELEFFPKIHAVRKTDSKNREIRAFPVNNYSVLYSVDEREQVVNILRVLYGRRNIDALP